MRSETISAEQSFRTGVRTISLARQIFQLIALCGLAIASYFLVSHFVLQAVRVEGISMSPTLHNADEYFLKRWVYYVRQPRRGDIVVIKDPSDGTFAVKRIVALAGETVFISKMGQLYVNGHLLSEPYLRPGTPTFFSNKSTGEENLTIGPGKYFVLGDNRNDSLDSRYYGPVPRQNLLGVITP